MKLFGECCQWKNTPSIDKVAPRSPSHPRSAGSGETDKGTGLSTGFHFHPAVEQGFFLWKFRVFLYYCVLYWTLVIGTESKDDVPSFQSLVVVVESHKMQQALVVLHLIYITEWICFKSEFGLHSLSDSVWHQVYTAFKLQLGILLSTFFG